MRAFRIAARRSVAWEGHSSSLIARAVVAKARPEDLQHILPGLGQVLAALALFLPWGRGRRGRPPRRRYPCGPSAEEGGSRE
ncbi:hypothetical protein GCM10010335_64800 [Streptomyces galbus]|nr:hypothetical protein GCM10010335_64800 [Streptomyces galbus]